MSPSTGPLNLCLDPDQIASFHEDGYLIAPGLFDDDLIRQVRDRYDAIAKKGEAIPGHWMPQDENSNNPLARYPRLMQPHRFDDLAMKMMLHPPLGLALRALLGEEAVACQTMYYFKPSGSKGQALHQDNFYLAVKPRTCIAAWTAIDPATPENGGMYVVPGSHRLDISCPDPKDFVRTQRTNLVEIPKGMKAQPAIMQPGDTLFFTGSVIHGSGPNRTKDQWRRSFISHYLPASSTHISKHYTPAYDFNGSEVSFGESDTGGPCGYDTKMNLPFNSYGTDAVID